MKRILFFSALILLTVTCDALRDCWSCGRAGYWAWHSAKWLATYPLYAAVLWLAFPLFSIEVIKSWLDEYRNRVISYRGLIKMLWKRCVKKSALILWPILIILSSIVWTLVARHIGGQPTWGGFLGIW